MLRLTAPRGALPLGVVFGAIGAAAFLAVGVLHLDRLPLTLCLFKAVTGWPCLTCGSTRALGRLFVLDLGGAVAMNPLAVLGALILVPWAAADAYLVTRGRALGLELTPPAGQVARFGAVALLAANWIYLIAAGR